VCQWSPDGFSWGYDGDQPTELAYTLLADGTGSTDSARRLAVRYGRDVIARLPQGQPWSLPVTDVRAWAGAHVQQTLPTDQTHAGNHPRPAHLRQGPRSQQPEVGL
jgi:hypothetical protein